MNPRHVRIIQGRHSGKRGTIVASYYAGTGDPAHVVAVRVNGWTRHLACEERHVARVSDRVFAEVMGRMGAR